MPVHVQTLAHTCMFLSMHWHLVSASGMVVTAAMCFHFLSCDISIQESSVWKIGQ